MYNDDFKEVKVMSKYVIEGMYWCAGDNVYIDTHNDENGWTAVCLNELIKDHIKENSNVKIIIDVENKHIKE